MVDAGLDRYMHASISVRKKGEERGFGCAIFACSRDRGILARNIANIESWDGIL